MLHVRTSGCSFYCTFTFIIIKEEVITGSYPEALWSVLTSCVVNCNIRIALLSLPRVRRRLRFGRHEGAPEKGVVAASLPHRDLPKGMALST